MSGVIKNAALTVGLWLSSTLNPCWAQSTPNADAELQRQEQQRQQLRLRNESLPNLRLQTPADAPPDKLPEEAPCRLLGIIRIQGTWPASLNRALAGPDQTDAPLNRCLGPRGIALLLDRLNNALIDQGYITSRAQALPQNLGDGELVLTIQAGTIDNIRTPAHQNGRPWARSALAINSGQVLNLRDIEQTLENLRRTPTADADIEISPGQSIGSSDIIIRYQRGQPMRLALSLDDNGSETTGKWQGNATLSWDNPLGLSDLFYISLGRDMAGRDPGPRGSRSQVLHYSLPFGYWLWSATSSSNRYHQTVAGAFQSYTYSGESSTQELQLSRVVYRSAASKTVASIKAFARRSSNFIDDTEVVVQQRRTGGWEAGLHHTLYLGQSTIEGQILYRHGTGAFGAKPAPEESFGEGTAFMRLTQGQLSLQSSFNVGKTTIQYNAQWRAQWNDTPLTPQDRFCLGGRYTVRGFDGVQSLCAERGQLLRNEMSTTLGTLPLQLYGGLDFGRVSGSSAPSKSMLAGSVMGLRGFFKTPGNGSLQWDIFVGKSLRKPTWFETARTTAGVSINASF